VSYRTAWRWFKADVLPVSARQLTNGTILIEAEMPKRGCVAIYARVSPSDQKELNDDLVQDMIDILTSFCARLYGRRSAKNRAKKAMRALSE
jgi:predicted site-specific integrase-resolvase